MSSARISFTKEELIKLSHYYGPAWGHGTKGAKKIAKALEQIKSKEATK